ncbi:hypothetical protein [Dyella silvatica]|uniref:hypothetical protein n=1 Tax=Dyella silvatica TaxID=2992128 RepID=UPI002256B59F|nr:hypothetical protein [Dyella silvatica]
MALLALAACLGAMALKPPYSAQQTTLFTASDYAGLPAKNRQVLAQADEDFQAVREGRTPVHAVLGRAASLPADAGRTFYIGQGYKLTVEKALSSFGGLGGITYGPILRLDRQFALGDPLSFFDLRVYSPKDIERLLRW